jgi:hypothetical protein
MFDHIVIRQAAAYLQWSVLTVSWLKALLKPEGLLTFNIFAQAPRFRVKKTRHNHRWYFEAGVRFCNQVYHLQASPGIGFDVTHFYQHNLKSLLRRLHFAFTTEILERGNSQTWICKRRK